MGYEPEQKFTVEHEQRDPRKGRVHEGVGTLSNL